MRLLLLILPLAVACHPSAGPVRPHSAQFIGLGTDSAFLIPLYDYGNAFPTSHREIVSDSSRYSILWALTHTTPNPPPRPTVDFRYERVAFAALGTFGATGPTITIDSLYANGTTLFAQVTSALCDGPYIGGMLVVSPSAAIRYPRRYTRVVFLERRTSFPGCD